MKDKVVIGIDQSYQDSGITICINGKVKAVTDCFTANLKNNTEKRITLKNKLEQIINYIIRKGYNPINPDIEVVCLIERIRLKSQGFVNINYIKGIGALNSLIVDKMLQYKIETYSVDTRAWKSTIIGTSKGLDNDLGIDPKKYPTIIWCKKNGYEKYIIETPSNKKQKGVIEKNGKRFIYNDNKADSIGIALYGFTNKPKIEKEK